MPVEPQYNSRHGGSRILDLASVLCRIVNSLAPVARAAWSDRPAFLAVLTACESVCALLPAARDEKATMDAPSLSSFDPADSVLFPGQTTL